MKSIEKLRQSSHLDDSKWTLETGDVVHVFDSEPNDPRAVNWGEQWRKIAEEIEAEIGRDYMKLPVDADGVPIRPGDLLESTDMDGCKERFTCDGFTSELPDGKGEMMPTSTDADAAYYAALCRHIEQDPLSELLMEMLDRHTDGVGLRKHRGDIYSFADEYAGRIRGLMTKEEA